MAWCLHSVPNFHCLYLCGRPSNRVDRNGDKNETVISIDAIPSFEITENRRSANFPHFIVHLHSQIIPGIMWLAFAYFDGIVMHWLRLIRHAHLIHIFILIKVDVRLLPIYRLRVRVITSSSCAKTASHFSKWLVLDERAARTLINNGHRLLWLQMNIDSFQFFFMFDGFMSGSALRSAHRDVCDGFFIINFPAFRAFYSIPE